MRESMAESIDCTPSKPSPAKKRHFQTFEKACHEKWPSVIIDEKGDTCMDSEVCSTVVKWLDWLTVEHDQQTASQLHGIGKGGVQRRFPCDFPIKSGSWTYLINVGMRLLMCSWTSRFWWFLFLKRQFCGRHVCSCVELSVHLVTCFHDNVWLCVHSYSAWCGGGPGVSALQSGAIEGRPQMQVTCHTTVWSWWRVFTNTGELLCNCLELMKSTHVHR